MSSETINAEADQSVDTSQGDDNDSEAVAVGEYTWEDFMREYGYADEIEDAYRNTETENDSGKLFALSTSETQRVPSGDDWDRVEFEPNRYLGFSVGRLESRIEQAAAGANTLRARFKHWIEATPVTKDEYTWEHFKWEYFYDEDGGRPQDQNGEAETFDRATPSISTVVRERSTVTPIGPRISRTKEP